MHSPFFQFFPCPIGETIIHNDALGNTRLCFQAAEEFSNSAVFVANRDDAGQANGGRRCLPQAPLRFVLQALLPCCELLCCHVPIMTVVLDSADSVLAFV